MAVLLGLIIATWLALPAHGSLRKEYLDFASEILTKQPGLMVLYKLDASDISVMSAMATNPLLVVTETDKKNKKMQDMLSSHYARGVVLLAQHKSLDGGNIETILNYTTNRRVYILGGTVEETRLAFNDYFKDTVIHVRLVFNGQLLLHQIVDTNDFNMVLSKDSKFLLDGPDIRFTLKGRNISLADSYNYPYLMPRDGRYTGIDKDLFDVVARKMGFTYHIELGGFGVQMNPATGKWSGAMGKDFAMGAPVEMSPLIIEGKLVFLVPKPKPLSPYLNFVKPFTLNLWIAWWVAYIVCSILSLVVLRFHNDNEMTLWQIAFNMFGAMWQQNLKLTLTSPSSGVFYVIFAFWTIGMTFKGAAYTCDLRSFIVKEEFEKNIDQEDDLLRTDTTILLPIMPKGNTLMDPYIFAQSPVKKELYARALKPPIEKVLDPGFLVGLINSGFAIPQLKEQAFISMSYVKLFLGYQPYRVTKIPAFVLPAGWCIQRNQPWGEELKVTILQILAGGIMDKIYKDNAPSYQDEPVQEVPPLEPYRLEHVAGPLIFLTCGLLLSMFVACLELLIGTLYTGLDREIVLHSQKYFIY